jgi:hypothetical protein
VCSRNHCCCGKSISITYPECVFVALAIQHTNCMPCIILSSVACLVPPHFSILSHKWHNFQEKKWKELKMCGFISSTMSETFLILRRIQWHSYHKCTNIWYKVPIIPVRWYWNSNFLSRFSKTTQLINFIKTCPVGAELFRADGRKDGQTDMKKLIVVLHNFANTPTNDKTYGHKCVFHVSYNINVTHFLLW